MSYGLRREAARNIVRSYGYTLTRTDHGEWRVNERGGDEATAYYTDDIWDAVGTARHMAAHRRDAEEAAAASTEGA